MKKVLILGSGRGQLPVMKLCREAGCEILAVSPKGNYPGIAFADQVLFEDVRNKEAILSYAEAAEIDAVLTDQLDEGVATAAYLADALGLPGIGYETALKFTDKFIMREEAQRAGLNVPQYIQVNSSDEAVLRVKSTGMSYPLVIKPVDSSASRGVVKVYNESSLKSSIKESFACSYKKQVIIEEFIEGQEYVVEAYTHNYDVMNLMVGHRDYFNIDGAFIPSATVFRDANSAGSEIEQNLQAVNSRLITSMGLKFGITHAEYIQSKQNNKIYLVEIAARGGGVFISSDLIPLTCGVNANKLLVQESISPDSDFTIQLRQGAAGYFCYLLPPGKISAISGVEQLTDIPGVCQAYFDNIEIGMKISCSKDKSARKGPVIIHGKTKADCYDALKKVKKALTVKVSTESELKDLIWT